MNVIFENSHKLNQISIEKADKNKIEEYKHIFDDCALYNHYFKKDPHFLDNTLNEAIQLGQGYVAADRNGEALGWATIMTRHDTVDGLPELFLLGVRPDARGKGIGRLLMEFYEKVMEGLGFKEIAIVVNDWNPRARKLYDRMGYKLRKSVEDPYIGGFTDHILVKKI